MKQGFVLFLLFFTSYAFGFNDIKNNTSVFFDVLEWQASEVSDDNWGQILGPTGTYQEIQFLNVPFKWSPGFRLGLDYQPDAMPWDIKLYYTGYKTQGKNQASVTAGEIHSAYSGNFYADNLVGAGISGPYYHSAAIQWNIQFNNVDLELGRRVQLNKTLSLRPFTGLKAAVINQDISTVWQQPFRPTTALNPTPTPITTFSTATENIANHFKGIGPSFGLDSTWSLYERPKNALNLIGDFSGALLWGQWKLSDVYQNNTPVSITVMNDSLSSAATMVRGYLGLEWEHALEKTQWNVRLGYEGQAWFSQLRYYTFDIGKLNDALFLHGATLDVSIHF